MDVHHYFGSNLYSRLVVSAVSLTLPERNGIERRRSDRVSQYGIQCIPLHGR